MIRISKYGISHEQAEEMYNTSECESCGDELNPSSANFDHCHTTGAVRGVLCPSCNKALGLLDDDLEKLQGLQAYLLRSMTNTSAEEYELKNVVSGLDMT